MSVPACPCQPAQPLCSLSFFPEEVMRTVRACSLMLLGCCVVALSAALVWAADKDSKALGRNGDAADKFPLQEGDVWVMAGDSITAQHLHSNYLEAFCYA